MIEFINVTIRNFLSYGNSPVTIDVSKPGTTLIMGENLDNVTEGATANGAGKTTIINAITYALYGKPVSKISVDNLINNINKKNMEVSVEFKIRDTHYKILRQRKVRGSSGSNVFIYVNGEDKTPDSLGATEVEITQIIGMPYDMFVRIVVISAAHVPFLDMPVRHASQANQSDFIEELFGITELSERAEVLKLKISDNEKRLTFKKNEITALEQVIERHATQIVSAKKRVITWEATNEQQIEELEQQLKSLEAVDIEEQSALFNRATSLKQQISKLNNDLRTSKRDQRDMTQKIQKLIGEINHLKDDKCPYCLQDFKGNADKVKKLVEEETSLQQTEVVTNALITEMEHNLEQLTDELNAVTSKITVEDVDALIKAGSARDTMMHKLEELKVAVNPYLDPLEELLSSKPEPVDYSDVNDITSELEHQKFLLKILTKKDSFARKALLDRNLPFLNSRLQHYLSDMGLPHKVEFTHEMTAAISQFGRPLDFGNLSAGQRARVNLALSLAFRDVRQKMHQKINICLFDEVLDIGLDAVGVVAAGKVIRKLAKDNGLSIYIISHKNEIEGMFDRTITIQLKQGFSYIKE